MKSAEEIATDILFTRPYSIMEEIIIAALEEQRRLIREHINKCKLTHISQHHNLGDSLRCLEEFLDKP